MWGGVSSVKLRPLFIAQKHCIRILFGDKESYLDKFKTTARVRPFQSQKLGQDFYKKERTKPLFSNHKILTVHNLYTYQILNATHKILKFRTPIAMFSCFKLSNRKENLLHLPKLLSHNFVYNASKLWNQFMNRRSEPLSKNTINETGGLNSLMKELLCQRQQMGGVNEWHNDINFVLQQS